MLYYMILVKLDCYIKLLLFMEPTNLKLVVVGDGVVGKTCLLTTFRLPYLAMFIINFRNNTCPPYSIALAGLSKLMGRSSTYRFGTCHIIKGYGRTIVI